MKLGNVKDSCLWMEDILIATAAAMEYFLMDLISCYYAWNFTYRPEFAVLALLQEVVIGDALSPQDFKKKCKLIEFQQEFRLKPCQHADILH